MEIEKFTTSCFS